jgi:hypothetical protein
VDGASLEEIDRFWELIQKCWDRDPQARPIARDLQYYIIEHRGSLEAALDKVQLLPPGLCEH